MTVAVKSNSVTSVTQLGNLNADHDDNLNPGQASRQATGTFQVHGPIVLTPEAPNLHPSPEPRLADVVIIRRRQVQVSDP